MVLSTSLYTRVGVIYCLFTLSLTFLLSLRLLQHNLYISQKSDQTDIDKRNEKERIMKRYCENCGEWGLVSSLNVQSCYIRIFRVR